MTDARTETDATQLLVVARAFLDAAWRRGFDEGLRVAAVDGAAQQLSEQRDVAGGAQRVA